MSKHALVQRQIRAVGALVLFTAFSTGWRQSRLLGVVSQSRGFQIGVKNEDHNGQVGTREGSRRWQSSAPVSCVET